MKNSTTRTITSADRQIAKRLTLQWNAYKNKTGTTQNELCKKLGVTQGAFSQFLNAHAAIPKMQIITIAKLLEVEPHVLDPGMANLLKIKDTAIKVVKVPILFTMENTKPRRLFVEAHALKTADNLYAVEVDNNNYAPFLSQGAHLICNPNTLIKENTLVFVRLLSAPSFVARLIKIDDKTGVHSFKSISNQDKAGTVFTTKNTDLLSIHHVTGHSEPET